MSATTPTANATAVVGVLVVSDRASSGVYEDRGGPAVVDYIESHFEGPPRTVKLMVPDQRDKICSAICTLAKECDLVLTTGGTGPSPRDVTPEATEDACGKMLPGFGERMRTATVDAVPTAILSRQTAGVCGNALVVNLPGSVKAIAECLDTVLHAIPHAVKLVEANGALKLLPRYHRSGRPCSECNVTH